MNPELETTPTPTSSSARPGKRRGVVLIAVLLIVVILALAGYQYSDLMFSEYKASENSHRNVQARLFAESGIHYAAALLASNDNYINMLGSNPWNNPQMFKDRKLESDGKVVGLFSIIAPPDPNMNTAEGSFNFGVIDESSKINLNALMKMDPSGQTLHDMLIKLPNMTEEIADAIVDWLDADTDQRPNGAENSYYLGQTPPYRVKNGPIDSIDELLLVRGVTRELLYGSDLNRNGVLDANETADDGFTRGWSAYLTVHSREPNCDSDGKATIFLGNADLTQLNTLLLEAGLSEDLVKYIIMYRQYGPASSSGSTQSLGSTLKALLGGGSSTTSSTTTVQGQLANYQLKFTRSGRFKIESIFDIIGSAVSISTTGKNNKVTKTIYTSPLLDSSAGEQIYKLFNFTSPTEDAELSARVNVNTAPREVLLTIPEITEADVDKVLNIRANMGEGEDISSIFLTPAWLFTEAGLSPTTLRKAEKYVTTRTQVYRVQSVGYYENKKGPAVRLEAVIDTNHGRPRIVSWRDLTELGRGYDPGTMMP